VDAKNPLRHSRPPGRGRTHGSFKPSLDRWGAERERFDDLIDCIELQVALNPAGDRKVEGFGWTFP
jgi:hypothetical protein